MSKHVKTTRTEITDLPELVVGLSDEHLQSVSGGLSRGVVGGGGVLAGNTVLHSGATWGPNSCTTCNDTDCGPD